MSIFSISLSDEQRLEEGLCGLGEITIGDFSESFRASLSYWNRQDYFEQWMNALNEITVLKRSKAVIISSMYDPDTANFILCWVMYNLGDLVCFQNHIFFLDNLITPFNEKNMSKLIPDREQVTEEGERISEWTISLIDIENSIKNLNLGRPMSGLA